MRLDQTEDGQPTAAQILNWSSEKALENIFKQVIIRKIMLNFLFVVWWCKKRE